MNLKVLLSLGCVYLIWGTSYLAIRFALEGLPPFGLAGLRFSLAGLLLMVALRLRGYPLPRGRQWGGSLVVGVLLLTVGNGGVVFSEQWVNSAVAAIMVASVGLWTAIFGVFFGQHTSRREWLAVFLGIGGVALLNLDKNLQAHPLGALVLTVAAASWALGSAWSKRLPLPAGPMASAAQMLLGGAVLLALGWLRGETWQAHPGLRPLLCLTYLCLVGSVVAFSAFSYLIQNVRPALATSYAYVNPMVALTVGVWLGHEQVSRYAVLALSVILGAVWLVAREHQGPKRNSGHDPGRTSPPSSSTVSRQP